MNMNSKKMLIASACLLASILLVMGCNADRSVEVATDGSIIATPSESDYESEGDGSIVVTPGTGGSIIYCYSEEYEECISSIQYPTLTSAYCAEKGGIVVSSCNAYNGNSSSSAGSSSSEADDVTSNSSSSSEEDVSTTSGSSASTTYGYCDFGGGSCYSNYTQSECTDSDGSFVTSCPVAATVNCYVSSTICYTGVSSSLCTAYSGTEVSSCSL